MLLAFHTTPHETNINLYTHHSTPPCRCSVSPARALRRTSSRDRSWNVGVSPILESLSKGMGSIRRSTRQELATPGSQPLKLVSEALQYAPLNPRLQMQRSGRIEGAKIAVFIPRIFLCCELSCSPSALTVCCEASYIQTAG